MSRVNTHTIRAFNIDRGNFIITKETMNLQNDMEMEGSDETFSLQQSPFEEDKLKEGDDFLLITIANLPCFAYASKDYEIADDLKPYIKTTANS